MVEGWSWCCIAGLLLDVNGEQRCWLAGLESLTCVWWGCSWDGKKVVPLSNMPWQSEMKFYSRLCSKWLPEGECLLLSASAARFTAWLQQGSLTCPFRCLTMGKANSKSHIPVWYFLVEKVDLLLASSRRLSSPQSRTCWTTLCYRASSLRILTPWSPLGALEGCSSNLWLRTHSASLLT